MLKHLFLSSRRRRDSRPVRPQPEPMPRIRWYA